MCILDLTCGYQAKKSKKLGDNFSITMSFIIIKYNQKTDDFFAHIVDDSNQFYHQHHLLWICWVH